MSEKPYLSIVIPLYNKEKQIGKTIESVLSQLFSDYELIIVNDGSTDNSLQVVGGYNDERIHILNQANAGVSAARNRGMSESKGEYVFLLDADDRLLPDALNILVSSSNDADIIIGSFNQTTTEGVVSRTFINSINGIVNNPYKAYCKKKIFLRIGNMFVKRIFLNEKGQFFRTDLSLYEDEEWMLRLMEDAILYSSSHVILNYVRGEGGLSFDFKSIDKDWASIASVKGVKNKFKKRILGDFIFRRLVPHLKWRDWRAVRIIWNNNSWRMVYCFYAFIGRSFRGGFIKNYIRYHYFNK